MSARQPSLRDAETSIRATPALKRRANFVALLAVERAAYVSPGTSVPGLPQAKSRVAERRLKAHVRSSAVAPRRGNLNPSNPGAEAPG